MVTVCLVMVERRGDVRFNQNSRLGHVDQPLLTHVNEVLHGLMVLV